MKFNKIFISLALAAVSFTACDEVDEADRFKELEKIESKRTVLLEDFTGQLCTNCPDGHRLIASLQEQYGENIIAVGIHAGVFGIGENELEGVVGLMQPEGDEYAKKWGVEAYPSAVIDRCSGAIKTTSDWSKVVRDEMTKPTDLNIELSATADDKTITITTKLQPTSDISGKLQLWITESNIKSFQIDNGSYLMDYVHNHVYRASVNGTWGEDISLTANIFPELTHSIAIKDNWNKENLAVVAFVYNNKEGVVQAAEYKLQENNNILKSK